MSGKIDISHLKVPPEKHELATARFFAERGHDIVFIPPNNSPKMLTPDIIMDAVEWEIKCPRGRSKRTIEHNYRRAAKQSKYIIFDLRRCPLPEANTLRQLKREFEDRHTKRLKIILKNEKLIEYPENI